MLAVGRAAATEIQVVGDPGDGMVDVNGVPVNLSDPTIRPGTGGTIIRGQAGVFFFALPTLGPGSSLTDAQLHFQYLGPDLSGGMPTPEFNLDLFGIGARPTATILSTDYYAGNAAGSSNTLIQAGFITPTTAAGSLTAGSASLLTFLDSLYKPNGTPVSTFAVFRLNPDVPLPVNSPPRRGYLLATADYSDAAFRPELDLKATATPEPSGLALLGGLATGLAGYCGWRRRPRSRRNTGE